MAQPTQQPALIESMPRSSHRRLASRHSLDIGDAQVRAHQADGFVFGAFHIGAVALHVAVLAAGAGAAEAALIGDDDLFAHRLPVDLLAALERAGAEVACGQRAHFIAPGGDDGGAVARPLSQAFGVFAGFIQGHTSLAVGFGVGNIGTDLVPCSTMAFSFLLPITAPTPPRPAWRPKSWLMQA